MPVLLNPGKYTLDRLKHTVLAPSQFDYSPNKDLLGKHRNLLGRSYNATGGISSSGLTDSDNQTQHSAAIGMGVPVVRTPSGASYYT